jgi:hypothetical protein
MKRLFIQYFEPILTAFVASLHAVNSVKATAVQAASWDFKKLLKNWDALFDKLLKELEDKAATVRLCLSAPRFFANHHSGSQVSHASCRSTTKRSHSPHK